MKFFILILCISILSAANGQSSKTEILWDNYGVPHVFGNTTAEMYYTFGSAQMHSHANLLLRLYGQARGRAAEYWGRDYINQDKKICCLIYHKMQGRFTTSRHLNTRATLMPSLKE